MKHPNTIQTRGPRAHRRHCGSFSRAVMLWLRKTPERRGNIRRLRTYQADNETKPREKLPTREIGAEEWRNRACCGNCRYFTVQHSPQILPTLWKCPLHRAVGAHVPLLEHQVIHCLAHWLLSILWVSAQTLIFHASELWPSHAAKSIASTASHVIPTVVEPLYLSPCGGVPVMRCGSLSL